MVSKKTCDDMVLHRLVKKISNGSASAVVEDTMDNLAESLFSHLILQVDEFDYLPKFLEAVDHNCDVFNNQDLH